MDNIKQVFNETFKKYYKKDYFGTKQIIKSRLEYAKQFNANIGKQQIVIKISDIKKFLKSDKEKCFNMILKRIEEKKEGKHFPKREKFTWEIFNKLSI